MRELLTLLFCSLVSAIDVFFFQELVVNPDILPREPNQRTFADIRIGNGLVDWEPYDLDILRARRKEHAIGRQLLLIKGGDGSDHECFLPLPVPSASFHDMDPAIDIVSQLKLHRSRVEQLRPACLQLQGSHWSYEVCPMKHVRQFHRELKKGTLGIKAAVHEGVDSLFGGALNDMLQAVASGGEQEIITDEYLLGRYVPESDGDQIIDGHFVQMYVDGDRCGEEENGTPRQTTVRYECSLAKIADHIIDVTEVSLCRYSIRIGSSRICSSQTVLPSSNHSIKCYPMSSSSAFNTSTGWSVEKAESNPVVPNSTTSSSKGPRTTGKKSDSRDNTFWRRRLHDFLAHDSREYPLVHKLLQDFMEAEQLALPNASEDIPQRLVEKWLAIIGLDVGHGVKDKDQDHSDSDDQKS